MVTIVKQQPTTVVFDVGGVLLDWNPRYLYRKLFDDEAVMEHFLTHICSNTWNLMQDAGRSFADGVAELSTRYPEHADLIAAYDTRWLETVNGTIEQSVTLLERLKAQNTPVYAITNYSREKFAITRQQFDFPQLFDGVVVSGEVRLLKPDPAIYLRLLNDYQLQAEDCVFIDDSPVNVTGAQRVGMHAIHFQTPQQLEDELTSLGLF